MSNYKVSGKKLTKQFHNCDPQPMPREDVKAYYRACGHPLRELCHTKPSMRRYKKAMKKADAGNLGTGRYERIAPGRVEFHPWVDFMQFHLKLGTLAFDVNIAPLANTTFNAAKSAIKFYEAAALKVPTLAQRTGPYADEIIDGDTGFLFEQPTDFVEKLEALVKDADLREKMGQHAYDWVREHRDVTKTVRPLAEFYHSLRSEVWSLPHAA